ncbi:MAG: transglycosylase domain-containing protein, partial [Clostridia bacterium]|nr:transglycosylase domain-containing protein [Clostridia bacterium]
MILLSIGVLFGAFFAAGLDTGIDTDLLKSVGDTTTRLFYYDENHEIAELTADRISGYQNSLYCPIEEMSPYLTGAFIAIEDKRFFDHGGIDWIRTASAMGDYLSGGGASFGGSTITQQLIKNLTGESEKSVRRKISELIRAAKLEEMLSKEEILEKYLNVVNLSENCYGVRTAANAYFSKEPDALTLGEAATIAAITNNPTRYNPIRHPEANRERRDLILAEMYKQGMIDDGLYQKTVATQTELHVNEDALSGRVNSWYADMVISDVIGALVAERGMSEAAASRLVFSGGLRIYTAQDPRLQRIVEEYYENSANFPVHQGGRQAQSAMMIVDPKNGDILAVVGAVGKKTSNRIQSYATDTRRPSGSVIKPLSVYAPALQRGIITTATVFDDIPHSFRENGAPWPKNAPNIYRGLTTVNT